MEIGCTASQTGLSKYLYLLTLCPPHPLPRRGDEGGSAPYPGSQTQEGQWPLVLAEIVFESAAPGYAAPTNLKDKI